MTREGPTWPWLLVLAIVLVAPLLMGCQSMAYDCKTWRQDDPFNQAKQAYCFPDCPSCGPAFRRPSYEPTAGSIDPL